MKPIALALVGATLALSTALVGTDDAVASSCANWITPEFFKSASGADIIDCLEIRPDLKAVTDKKARTPLHVAARYAESADVVDALLHEGADLHARDKDGWTPLHLASARDNAEIVSALLQARADYDAPGKHDWTPLHVAAATGKVADIIEELLAAGAKITATTDDGFTPLHLAAIYNTEPSVLIKLAEDTDIDVDVPTASGLTPLHLAAAYSKKSEIIRALIEAGADPNASDEAGSTPLSWAVVEGNEYTIPALMEKGANLNLELFDRSMLLEAVDGLLKSQH